MKSISRIRNLIIASAMIGFAVVLLAWPEFGPQIIMMVAGVALLIYGIYSLLFFFTMAINMVGGKAIFYRGVLLLDLGVFMLAAYKGSERLVFMYMMVLLGANGAIDLVRALEFRNQGAGWALRAILGVACMLLLIAGFIYRKDPRTLTYLFCFGLLTSAINRIVSAFKKTAVIYIP